MSVPRLVYFSSVTENTKIFLERLDYPLERIPIYARERELDIDYPYILVVPTYGGGVGEASVPPQVKRFLKHKKHRDLCVGIIGSGNLNFGEKYAAAGDILSRKLGVPMLYRFELRGDAADAQAVTKGINDHWDYLLESRRRAVESA